MLGSVALHPTYKIEPQKPGFLPTGFLFQGYFFINRVLEADMKIGAIQKSLAPQLNSKQLSFSNIPAEESARYGRTTPGPYRTNISI
jgi:hypothetical protein